MHMLGTHDSDPWNFIEAAMEKTTIGLTQVAVYYFYMQCKMIPDIDAWFMPFLDPSMKDSSCSIGEVSSLGMEAPPNSASKKVKPGKGWV